MPDDANKLLNKNMALLAQMSPSLHTRVADILAAGMPPFAVDSPYKKFRFPMGPATREDIDVQTFDFLERLLGACNDQDLPLFDTPRDEDAYYLLLVGTPADHILEAALDTFKPRCLIVGVGDLARFAASMAAVDWTRHLSRVQQSGGTVYLLAETTPEAIVDNAWRTCRQHNPTRIDGLTALVQGDTALQRYVAGLLAQSIMLSVTLLGFFHDETVMHWNTFRNMNNPKVRTFQKRNTRDLAAPAFVVASGPSLDNDIETIKHHADSAIVVSVASALRPLLAAGIKPDFHVELENVYITPKLVELSKHHDLGGITLVAAASVETAVLDYVGTAILYARYALSSYPIFSSGLNETLRLPGPTAGNAALCFALESGFREVFLFGLDLGTFDPAQHHAQTSFYYTEDAEEHVSVYNIAVPGNFRERIFTSRQFMSALKNVTDLTRMFTGDVRIANCSDGAMIDGAVPLRAADLSIAANGGQKAAALAALDATFAPADIGHRDWPGTALGTAIDTILDAMTEALSDPKAILDGSYEQPLLAAVDLKAGYQEPPALGAESAARMMVRGTVLSMILFMERARNRVANPADLPRFAEIAAATITRSLAEIRDQAKDLLGGDAPKQPPPVEARIAAAGRTLPLPLRLPRNSPCPCGSGQKFKHCHGSNVGVGPARPSPPPPAPPSAQEIAEQAHRDLNAGRHQAALDGFRAVVAAHPDVGELYINLGAALRGLGRLEEAEAAYRDAIARVPDNAAAWFNLGNLLRDRKRHQDALAAYSRADALQPGTPQFLNNLGVQSYETGDIDAAVGYYDAALRASPDFIDAVANRGNALQRLGRMAEVERDLSRVLELAPDNPVYRLNMSAFRAANGAHDDALVWAERAVAANPDYTEAQLKRASLLIQQGRLEEGFAAYEARWRIPGWSTFADGLAMPAWDGGDLGGKHLLVWNEQGFGDALMYARYLPALAARAGAVTFMCEPALARLMRISFGERLSVADLGGAVPPADLQVSVMSLPFRMNTGLTTIPAAPYLKADPAEVEVWRQRLQAAFGRKRALGLAWAGNPGQAHDYTRSMPAETAARLLAADNAGFVNLLVGRRGDEITDRRLLDVRDELADFAATAALMQALDGVISVDSAPAHLAGALGRPVSIALAFDPDSRYLLRRNDSPWYPSASLYRQAEPGNWDGVVARLMAALVD